MINSAVTFIKILRVCNYYVCLSLAGEKKVPEAFGDGEGDGVSAENEGQGSNQEKGIFCFNYYIVFSHVDYYS